MQRHLDHPCSDRPCRLDGRDLDQPDVLPQVAVIGGAVDLAVNHPSAVEIEGVQVAPSVQLLQLLALVNLDSLLLRELIP